MIPSAHSLIDTHSPLRPFTPEDSQISNAEFLITLQQSLRQRFQPDLPNAKNIFQLLVGSEYDASNATNFETEFFHFLSDVEMGSVKNVERKLAAFELLLPQHVFALLSHAYAIASSRETDSPGIYNEIADNILDAIVANDSDNEIFIKQKPSIDFASQDVEDCGIELQKLAAKIKKDKRRNFYVKALAVTSVVAAALAGLTYVNYHSMSLKDIMPQPVQDALPEQVRGWIDRNDDLNRCINALVKGGKAWDENVKTWSRHEIDMPPLTNGVHFVEPDADGSCSIKLTQAGSDYLCTSLKGKISSHVRPLHGFQERIYLLRVDGVKDNCKT